MKRVTALLCAITMFGFIFNASYIEAATVNPKTLLEKKFPREQVKVSKSVDLNVDKKKEHLLITESGNFYLINSKGVIVLIDTNYYSDEEPTIQILNVSAKEKHVAVTLDYLPSNTELLVYKYQNGTLKKKLSVMGDVGIEISKTGEIIQMWKNYYPEGGWKIAVASYKWNSKKDKYVGSGELPR
ncbi:MULTISPECIES: hypothetical protein [unclassified Paenibacillus]|uniref:hypothetical protein n=1 Tax=unclassified Paenibacillus TaxID=185978 RepID=UPI0008C52CA2|nr:MULTISPECIES: hypothetical protein [unclassified Paenibacillus]QLG39959.1 hypothetical protein HW560_18850 [Paenibacillus sp. E222]SEN91075.1 hypothetical protein SAMN05518670_3036 [Paenibacillus sp. OK076]